MTVVRKVESYGLDPAFERAAVTLACTKPRFFGRIGHALDPDALGAPAAKLAVQAAQAIATDTGNGPASTILVVQRLRRWMSEGRCTLEAIEEVGDLFDLAEDAGLPGEDAVVAELTPVLQRRMQHDAVRAALDDFGHHGDMQRVAELVVRAARLGQADSSVGVRLGAGSFEAMAAARMLIKLEVGISELDLALEGGLARGALGVVVGESGAGKSLFLSHVAANAVLMGLHVVYATLELPEYEVLARLKGNLTGLPTRALLNGAMGDARVRLAALDGKLGPCIVKEFTPKVTAVEDLDEWIGRCGEATGKPVDLLLVDYGDRLGAGKLNEGIGEYRTGGVVFEGLRVMAMRRKLWCWTASQSKRKTDKKQKKLDLDDVADSMHKVRVADVVVTLNVHDDGDQLLYYVAKHRTGKGRASIGPMPHDFVCGRMVMLSR